MCFNQAKQGFTLIELLVVVLIIGILAAVALPQYEKAVAKSRAVQAITLVKSLGQAAENYYLANGSYPTKFDQLDVDIPADWTGNEKVYNVFTDSRSNQNWAVSIESGVAAEVIHLGAINGPYAGSGFSYYLYCVDDSIPQHQVLCMEAAGISDYIFKKNIGDFCVKLFKGTLTHNGNLKLYTLP